MYQHILFAADFSEDALRVGEHAREMAQRCGAQLSLIHVVEDLTISLGGGYELLPVLPDLPDETLMQEAQAQLGVLAQRLETAIARFSTRTWPLLRLGMHRGELSPVDAALYRAFLTGERVPTTQRRLYDLLS